MFYKILFDADSENHVAGDLGRRGGSYRSLISVVATLRAFLLFAIPLSVPL